jgi:hypothetical protein
VRCPSCQFEACGSCVRRFLLETSEDYHCMNCRFRWTHEFVETCLPRRFCNGDLAVHRRAVLLARERAKLPGTLREAERVRQRREALERTKKVRADAKLMKEKIAEAMAMKRNMSGALRDLQKRPSSPEVDTLSYQLTRSMEDLKEEMLAVREDLTQAEGVLEELLLMVEDLSIPLDPVRTEPPGARPCPKEGCRGFVKGTPEWACGLCNSRVCPRCERIEATGHRCVAEDVETARLIRRDTKPCPGCAAPIEKIDGCDQMFCVSCTTVFSWDTGRVQATGQVHNPEYFRWLRDRGEEVPRDPDDTPCGPRDNLPPYQVVLPLGDACNRAYDALLTNVNWYRNWREQPADDVDLRVGYLLGELDEPTWASTLLSRERKRERALAVFHARQMLAFSGANLFWRLAAWTVVGEPESDGPEAIAREFEALRQLYNESVDRIYKRFGSTHLIPKLDPACCFYYHNFS